jgi:uncharacterized protein (DUF1499 family)
MRTLFRITPLHYNHEQNKVINPINEIIIAPDECQKVADMEVEIAQKN